MAKERSRWLGPKRRKQLYGTELGGAPRFTEEQQKQVATRYGSAKGYRQGARVPK